MNKRAERFKKFIADQKVEGFTIEEPKSEPNNLVLFRSNFRMDGNLLPFGIFVDDTPFAMIRVVVVAEALRDDNEKEVTGLINQLNLKYKPYKFYIDGAKNLMAESCVIFRDGEDAVGDMLLFVLNLAQQDLGKEYKAIMQTVWGKGSEDKKQNWRLRAVIKLTVGPAAASFFSYGKRERARAKRLLMAVFTRGREPLFLNVKDS